MATITLKCLFLATALLSAKAARPAEVAESQAAMSVSDTAVHMATASALLQAQLVSKPSQRLAPPGSNGPDPDEWDSEGEWTGAAKGHPNYDENGNAVQQQEVDLSPQANNDVASGALPDGDNDGFDSESMPNMDGAARQNSAEDRAMPVDDGRYERAGANVDHLANSDTEANPAGQVEGQSARDDASEEAGAQQIPARATAESKPVHIPAVISDSMVPTGEEIESKNLFKRTAEESKNLQEAAHGIDSTIHRVDQAIQKVYGATDKYHASINSLTGQFGKLKDMSTDVHTEVLSEFKDRESDRMCAFENVERMLRGEPFQHCNTASAPANGDYSSHFASSVQQPRDEKLLEARSEEHPAGSPGANAAGGAGPEGMPGANGAGRPPQGGVGSEAFGKV